MPSHGKLHAGTRLLHLRLHDAAFESVSRQHNQCIMLQTSKLATLQHG